MKHFKKLTYPYVLWSALMIVIPLILIAIYAFTTDGNTVTLDRVLENFARIMEPTYLKRFLEVHKNGSDHNVYLPAGRLSAGLYDLPVPRGGSGAADFGGDDPYMD